MKLELVVVRQKPNWQWQRRIDGAICASSVQYASERAAVTGLIDDFVASVKHVASMAYVVMTVEEERELRKTLRKQVIFLPSLNGG